MRETLGLQEPALLDLLQKAYGLTVTHLEFLPIGADVYSAKYRVETGQGTTYFLKVKTGRFKEIAEALPGFLDAHDIHQVIPPLQTTDGQLWTVLDGNACSLYPYIEGQDGFERELSEQEWSQFGSALRRIHSLHLPPALERLVPVETYSSEWRERVQGFQAEVESRSYADAVTAQLATLMQQQREIIRYLLERAEQLAGVLRSRAPEQVLCHADLHARNLLHTAEGRLYITDWDDATLAPRERDLMFIGGGVVGIWNTPREEALFYRGYGPGRIDLTALCYYRCERILVDVAAFCEEILSVQGGNADRQRSLQYFSSMFLPGGVLEMASRTDQLLRAGVSFLQIKAP